MVETVVVPVKLAELGSCTLVKLAVFPSVTRTVTGRTLTSDVTDAGTALGILAVIQIGDTGSAVTASLVCKEPESDCPEGPKFNEDAVEVKRGFGRTLMTTAE